MFDFFNLISGGSFCVDTDKKKIYKDGCRIQIVQAKTKDR